MLTQSKAQTTGITDKQHKDMLGILSKEQQRKEQTDHLVQKRRNPTTRISREKQTFRPDIRRPKVKEDPQETKRMRAFPKARRIHPQAKRCERPKASNLKMHWQPKRCPDKKDPLAIKTCYCPDARTIHRQPEGCYRLKARRIHQQPKRCEHPKAGKVRWKPKRC
jgi:hypothetical protein